ncbi:type IV pilin protein [Stenotrophomonas sp.]|uniref:type IV pilin protein n=1 Tax=Stenotrophomonas sp. TaxID=69392 RepID=UPI0028A64979|nr:type IV pilin protein [Stenotrophomonas sp.]
MRIEQKGAHAESTRRARSIAGFTLIELMVVVAVIAILAAVALPSYAEHVRKARRGQAKADMVEYAQLAERFHTVNNSYAGFTLSGSSKTIQSPREGGTAQYSIVFDGTQSTFTIKATPQGGQAKDTCGEMTLNQANVKTPSASSKPGCW